MLLTPHTLIGIAISSLFRNPIISFPLSFVSHFLADLIPHWDFFYNGARINKQITLGITLDFLTAFVLGIFFALKAQPNNLQTANIIGCSFFSNLPDGIELFYLCNYRWPWVRGLTKLQKKLQTKMRLPWGLIPQVLLSIVILAALIIR